MINIAPFNYQRLLNNSKIIKDIIQYRVKLLNGEELYETSAKLSQELVPKEIFQSKIYSNFDGSGTSKIKNESLYKSLSEALERWAFYESSEGASFTKYKYDINPSTCGMSSFPELFPYWCKRNAEQEAVERFAIHAFNRGTLPVKELESKIDGLKIYKINSGIENKHVILLCYFNGDFYSYAFSCKGNDKASIHHSLIELARNERVLKKFKMNPFDENNIEMSDKRLIYFSTHEGNLEFQEKLKLSPSKILEKPKLILSEEIKGPWSTYARTWRHLFDKSYDLDQKDQKYFMF